MISKTSLHSRETFFGLLLLFFGGSSLTLGRGVFHLSVGFGVLCVLLRLLGILCGLALGLNLSTLLGGFFLLGLQNGLALGLDLVLVALDDGARNEADLILLRNVDRLAGVLTLLVEPILKSHISMCTA